MDASNRPQPSTNSGINVKFISKWILAAVIIFGGITAGIYTGTALSFNNLIELSPEELSNTSYLSIGESFPDYQLRNPADNSVVSIAELTQNGPILFAFVSSSCGYCDMMNTYWRKKMIKEIDPDIQLIWVYDENDDLPEDPAVSIFPGVRVMTTGRFDQYDTDGMNSTPSLVGLDQDRTIRFVMSGFNRQLGSSFFNNQL